MPTTVAECAADSRATDEIAPFHWKGNGCRGFAHALLKEIRESGQTDELMTLRSPVVVDVAGNAGYASIPGHLTFKTKDNKPASEDGMFAVTMTKVGGKWKVTSWSWATTKT